MSKITPFLWFDTQAEEAMDFYTSIFKNSKKGNVARYPEGGPMPAGTAMMVEFELDGQKFMGMNAGPQFKFNESISMYVNCADQEEVDYYWDALLADGGEESQCGWLKDKFGLSWQIIPKQLGELVGNPDPEIAGKAMAAMMEMKKIDVAKLQVAVERK